MATLKRSHSESELDFISFSKDEETTDTGTQGNSGHNKRSKITCFGCGQTGHMKYECPNKYQNTETADGRLARMKREKEIAEAAQKNETMLSQLLEHKRDRGVPWVLRSYHQTGIIALHQEILDYVQYMRPSNDEFALRQNLVDRIMKAAKTLWPKCAVEVFGSFRTCLYTPSSDIDVVVFGEWPRAPLHTMAQELVRQGLASWASDNIRIIDGAKVPIVKFRDISTGIDVDISFNQPSGPSAADIINGYIGEYPCLLPLLLVLKQFLAQRKLNEPFTGGLGSYSLVLMVVAFLQMHPRIGNQDETTHMNLGVLLLEFFEFYGHLFDYDLGISIREGGSFFNKEDRFPTIDGFRGRDQGRLKLCLEDPQRPDNDVSGGSYAMDKVRRAFQLAYDSLQTTVLDPNSQHSPTALSSIITLPAEVDSKRRDREAKWRSSAQCKLAAATNPCPKSPTLPKWLQFWLHKTQQQ